MKALTLHQPWASLIALGVKTIETRSWATKYRGPLAIHAGLSVTGWRTIDDPSLMEERGQVQAVLQALGVLSTDGRSWPTPWISESESAIHLGDVQLPLGAVVATCTLVDVVPTADLYWTGIWRRWAWQTSNGAPLYPPQTGPSVKGLHVVVPADQRPYGDFTPGRFAWLLEGIEPVDPPIASPPGEWHRGLWTWEPVAA